MKIDALRKSFDEQVKQLQVQIQEAEAAALLGKTASDNAVRARKQAEMDQKEAHGRYGSI